MNITPNRVTDDTMCRIREETSKDPLLTVLRGMILSGRALERKEVPEEITDFRDETLAYDPSRVTKDTQDASGYG